MKNQHTIPFLCLLLASMILSWIPEKGFGAKLHKADTLIKKDSDSTGLNLTTSVAFTLYESMELESRGLSLAAFEYAYKGYQFLVKENKIRPHAYLVICDFSQSSDQKRFYLIDMEKNEVMLTTFVAHGLKSGGARASRFSNRPGSHQSSLGFYTTANSYQGEHGLSLKLVGLDRGFNDKALDRHIVIHGAGYIGESWLERYPFMGRSFGCPAIPKQESDEIIETIRNGSCIFIYHPSPGYLLGSKILNG